MKEPKTTDTQNKRMREQKRSLLKVKQHSPKAEIHPITSRIKVQSRGQRGNSREKNGGDIKYIE